MLIPASKFEVREKKEFQSKYDAFQKAVEKGNEKGYDFENFSQDLFSSLYQLDPKFPEQASTGAEWAKKALDELRGLPEFKEFRESGTKSDAFQSGLGATCLTKHFAESFNKAPEEQNPDNIEQQIQEVLAAIEALKENSPDKAAAKVSSLEENVSKLNQAKEKSEKAWNEMSNTVDTSALRQTMRRAIESAKEEIEQANQDAQAFGFGREPGSDGYTNSAIKLAIAEKIKQYPKLRKLAELAGRFKREARKQQANKKQPGPDEITDIEMGNDVGRLIPAELALLGDEATELGFFKRYLERSLIQYKLEERPFEHKGPIIVCLDNSGSMEGDKEIWSKALALGICSIAAKDKRTFIIKHFNVNVVKNTTFVNGEIDPNKMVESMSFFSGGGTDFVNVLNDAIDEIEKDSLKGINKADIILITDGCYSIPLNNLEEFKSRKNKLGFKLYSIIIDSVDIYKNLTEISDKTFTAYNLLTTDDTSEIKETIFSI